MKNEDTPEYTPEVPEDARKPSFQELVDSARVAIAIPEEVREQIQREVQDRREEEEEEGEERAKERVDNSFEGDRFTWIGEWAGRAIWTERAMWIQYPPGEEEYQRLENIGYFKYLLPTKFNEFMQVYMGIEMKRFREDHNYGMVTGARSIRKFGSIPNVSFEDLPAYLRSLSPRKARLYCEELLAYSKGSDRNVFKPPIRYYIEKVTGNRWALDDYTKSDWAQIPDFLEACKLRERDQLHPPTNPLSPPDHNEARAFSAATPPDDRKKWDDTPTDFARKLWKENPDMREKPTELARFGLKQYRVVRRGTEEEYTAAEIANLIGKCGNSNSTVKKP